VAPAKPLKKIASLNGDRVLQITLDHIESDSGRLIKHNRAPVSEAGSSTHWFDNRHVLYSKLRPYLNKVYLPDELGIGTTELVPMLPNETVLDRKYLAYFLRSKTFVDWVSSQTAGAKMPRVSMKVFWDYEIPLPPLSEQKRIAAILDKADAIRRKRQQAIQLADEFLRAVFLDMFGDPVTNPKGWEVKALKEISRIQIGPFGTQLHKEDYINGGIPLINPTHIVKGHIVPKDDLTITAEKHASLPEYHLAIGDIIMGRRGEMGRCAVVGENEKGWLCGTGSLFIRPNKTGVFSEYLNKLLASDAIKSHLETESQGATMPNLNKTIVGNIQVPCPSDEALNRFSEIKIKTINSKLLCSDFSKGKFFESITQKAFSGDL
jgi:type I restriction enzyme S subunit